MYERGVERPGLDAVRHREGGDGSHRLTHIEGVRLQAGGAVRHAALGEVLLRRQETVDGFWNEGFERDRERTEAAFAELMRDIFGPIQAFLQEFGFIEP